MSEALKVIQEKYKTPLDFYNAIDIKTLPFNFLRGWIDRKTRLPIKYMPIITERTGVDIELLDDHNFSIKREYLKPRGDE